MEPNPNPQLHPHHYNEWLQSGVDPAIVQRNIWTIEDPQEVDKLLNRNDDRRWKHSTDLVPGWAVAGVNPKTGELTLKGAQYKPETPPIDTRTGKPRKYVSPTRQTLAPLFLRMEDNEYWQRLIFEFSQPIILTEGAKKAGSLLSLGLPCISIPGVATGGKLGRLRPELEIFCKYGRTIYLAFDRDVVQKKAVKQALHNLGRMLAAKGCQVYVLEWANQYKGIDDWLSHFEGNLIARNHLMQAIDQAHTLEEWRDEQEEKADLMAGEQCKLALRYEMIADKLRGRIRWNGLKSVPELDGQECDLDDLRLWLAIKHNIDVPAEDCAAIVTYLAKQSQFSPVKEYLKTCSELYEADGDLLNSIASRYLGSTSELHQVMIRKTLISAVARAFQPGAKVDTVCILSGGQGVGKSSFWKALAGDWFDDSVGSVSDKDERLKLHQAWLIEWAELEAVFKRKDISAVKAFITTQTDQIRPPYGRVVKEFPRPSIIVGTTNFDEFLADPTGNRRFWVVPVSIDWIPLDELAAERDRIWAAATHAFLSGENWTLPDHLREASAAANLEYQLSDPWENPVLDYVEGLQEVLVEDILINALHIDVEDQDRACQMRVTNLLKTNGWRSSRKVVHGRRRRVWFSPSFIESGCPGCPIEDENQTAVAGQPSGQPLGQPPGQPLDFAQKPDAENQAQPVRDNLPILDIKIPKSTRTQEQSLALPEEPSTQFDVGDHVEILKGQFVGKRCQVEAVESVSITVRAKGWYVSQIYPPEELRLLSTRASRQAGCDRALANGATLADAIKQYPDEV